MNTHRAVIESSVPPMLSLIASGSRDFCIEMLASWISGHPLDEFEEGRIFCAEEAEVWDEGFAAGWAECSDPGAFVNDAWDAKTPNPYRAPLTATEETSDRS